MKFLDIDALMRSDGWTGLIARFIVTSLSYIIIYWLPQIHALIVPVFILDRYGPIDERRHRMAIYLATILFGCMVILSVFQAIKLLRRKK